MLQLKDINKSFGNDKVLEGINLEIQDREFVVLVGPSGSGKSTLIRIIAGLERQDSGEIIFNGQEIQDREPKDRKLAMVFQNYALYPHKTVFDNIAFPLRIHGKDRDLISSRVGEIANKLDIQEYLERKPKELSGGQRQRVALARALAKDPEICLLDEPLSNLDAKLRTQTRHEIFNLRNNSNATFIYVTHDQIEALTLGDRIVVLHDGAIQQIGTPEEVYNQPANDFVATFIGSPATNLLELASCEDARVGIRAEFLKLEPGSSNDAMLEIVIQNIEMLGQEYLIYGILLDKYANTHASGQQRLVAKIQHSQAISKLYQSFIKTNLDENKNFLQIPLYYDRNLLYYFNRIKGDLLK